ncbi:MAG: leucine-rich repeat protein, partial [Ruminococcus sp.]|nr:leucine-rich repeat protein [Ruminococcus sp.]
MKMKRLLSFALSLVLVLGSASALPSGVFDESTSITASAEVETNDQNYSDYEFKDNGDGTATLVKYVGLDEHVAVPAITSDGKEVTSIGKNAFAEDYYLTEVTIPNTVTNIEEEAFENSPILKINLPSSIKTIGKRAFYQSQLSSVTIPESVTSIGDEAFADCAFLKDVTILGSVENFGDNVFWWSGVSQVSFGDNVKCIGKEAFSKCGFLKNITIPGNIKSIDERAFYYSGLENVIIEQGVETIAKGAFEDCFNLNSLSIAKSINHFGADAFKNTPWLKVQKDLTPLVIVNKILIAANGKECTGEINIPDGVIAIGGKAFVECYYMTSVKIPNSVTSIGEGAFEGCFITDKSARSLDIPKSVTDIGDNAFASCGLKSIVIPSSVNRIGKKAFYYSWLESLTIRNGVETIDDEAFWGCSKLNRVSIPSSVRTIGERAFANTGLTSITIPKTVTLIGKRAFGYDYDDVRISDFKIYAYKGSAGEEYAKKFLLVVNYIIDDPTRLAGAGRYETAVEISKAGFPDGSDTVVLAYGLNYADALAGVSLAKAKNAPILLTNLKTLPAETLAEIKRLKAKNVIILGGTGAVGK